MLVITRWAGRHPLFVRAVLLPILFYLQGRLAFIAGADLFFDGVSLPDYWLWGMTGILCLAFVVYPTNARSILHTHYWRIKGLEWLACAIGFGLWFYVGNQMAQQFEGAPARTSSAVLVIQASVTVSEGTTPETDGKNDNKLKKAYRNYFKAAIKQIKEGHNTKRTPLGLIIVLGVIGIGLGIAILVCGIQCGSAGGGAGFIALGSIFALLGIVVIIAGISRRKSLKE